MTDVKATVAKAQVSKHDGAHHISPDEFKQIKADFKSAPQSTESLQWLQKENPDLYAALGANLDYSGYTGITNNMQARGEKPLDVAANEREGRVNHQPRNKDYDGDEGMPKALGKGDPIGHQGQQRNFDIPTEDGKQNTIKVGNPITITDAEAATSKEAQRDYTAKMSGVLKVDVPNPPTPANQKAYLQELVNRGESPDRIKSEHGEFLKTFYRHPGGVTWDPPLKSEDVDKRFAQMPVTKDGKRLIDCEGYAAVTENVLGGLKQKNGEPVFDVKCAASNQHVVAGVFPHGGDARKGFIVDNDSVTSFNTNMSNADYSRTSPDGRQRALLRENMTHPDHIGHMGSPKDYGPFDNMKPPPNK